MINLPYISKVGKGRQVDTADNGGREDPYQRTVHGKLFLSGMLLSQGCSPGNFAMGTLVRRHPGESQLRCQVMMEYWSSPWADSVFDLSPSKGSGP